MKITARTTWGDLLDRAKDNQCFNTNRYLLDRKTQRLGIPVEDFKGMRIIDTPDEFFKGNMRHMLWHESANGSWGCDTHFMEKYTVSRSVSRFFRRRAPKNWNPDPKVWPKG